MLLAFIKRSLVDRSNTLTLESMKHHTKVYFSTQFSPIFETPLICFMVPKLRLLFLLVRATWTNRLSLALLSAAWYTSNQHLKVKFLPHRKLSGPHYRKQAIEVAYRKDTNTLCGQNANIIIKNQQNYLLLSPSASHKYILNLKYKALYPQSALEKLGIYKFLTSRHESRNSWCKKLSKQS